MKKIVIIILVLIVIAGGVYLIIRGRALQPQNTNIQTGTSTGAQTESPAQIEAKKYQDIIKELTVTDSDLDGLTNDEEKKLGTDPEKSDTDNDGLLDKDEINIYKTDPLKADTDGDGKTDGYEARHRTDPLKK
jgi:hypothetical protein